MLDHGSIQCSVEKGQRRRPQVQVVLAVVAKSLFQSRSSRIRLLVDHEGHALVVYRFIARLPLKMLLRLAIEPKAMTHKGIQLLNTLTTFVEMLFDIG